jgi:nucleoid-associated protein YgaU
VSGRTVTVTVAGGNLFALAAEYLGDATQWIRIAQANGLRDPVLVGVVTLLVPPVNTAAGGGLAV